MRILFTSDLHGNWEAIKRFTNELSKNRYDVGVISGDILDDGIPNIEMAELFETTDLEPDDFLPELQGADETFEEYMQAQIAKLKDPNEPYLKSLQIKEQKIRQMLTQPKKRIYIVPGNHDQTSWISDEYVVNVDGTRLEHGKFNVVGYRWTDLDRSPRDHIEDVNLLESLVDTKTILITHRPAFGYLDYGTDENKHRTNIGSKEMAALIDSRSPLLHLFGHVHGCFGAEGFRINGSFPRSKAFYNIKIGCRKGIHARIVR